MHIFSVRNRCKHNNLCLPMNVFFDYAIVPRSFISRQSVCSVQSMDIPCRLALGHASVIKVLRSQYLLTYFCLFRPVLVSCSSQKNATKAIFFASALFVLLNLL